MLVVSIDIITMTRFSIKFVLTYTAIFYSYYQVRVRPATGLLGVRIDV